METRCLRDKLGHRPANYITKRKILEEKNLGSMGRLVLLVALLAFALGQYNDKLAAGINDLELLVSETPEELDREGFSLSDNDEDDDDEDDHDHDVHTSLDALHGALVPLCSFLFFFPRSFSFSARFRNRRRLWRTLDCGRASERNGTTPFHGRPEGASDGS